MRKLYAQANLFDGDADNAEFVARIAKLPLAEQPGTLWDYGHSTDVLGRVIEVVSGKSLLQFEKERLFEPLGMTETAFYRRRCREAAAHRRADAGRSLHQPDRRDQGSHDAAALANPAAAGMVGTIGDYARFAQMLLNGGTLEGRRYLKPETVALMTSDHIGPETNIVRDHFYFPGATSGFGLGFAVRTSTPPNTSWPLGEYRWDGVAGTFFFVDPKHDMFAIFMMQTPSQRGRIQLELKTLIYQALDR